MRIFFSLLVFSFMGGSLFSAGKISQQLVEQKNRSTKEDEDNEVKSIFQLIKTDKLDEAETRLEKSTLVPDSTLVEYCEWEKKGPFRRRSFEIYLGGKSYLWGTLALEYLKKGDLDKAKKASNQIDEKLAPRPKKQVEQAI
jgi:hypothetical protein